MADSVEHANELFIFGDDFDAILEVLESDEGMEEQFTSAVCNVQSQEIVCSDCGKKYKTKGGFQRHRAAKHSLKENGEQQKTLNPRILDEIVRGAIGSVKENKVFSEDMRNELNSYIFEQLEEGTTEFTEIKTMYERFLKDGNAEKFYGKYYAQIPLNSTRFFKGLSHKSATLLSTKVADCMLAYCKKERSSTESREISTSALSEQEKAGLQYLGGYVLHNLHSKHRKANSAESFQAMAILKVGKLETSGKEQKLISSLNRGGLWSITEPAQKIFEKTEQYFRQFTSKSGLQRIDIAGISYKSVTDCDILSNYQLILSDSELAAESSFSKDVLSSIIGLYVRVRSFSFAKDFIQNYKIKMKQAKAKSLRKEISRSCEEKEQQRHA